MKFSKLEVPWCSETSSGVIGMDGSLEERAENSRFLCPRMKKNWMGEGLGDWRDTSIVKNTCCSPK